MLTLLQVSKILELLLLGTTSSIFSPLSPFCTMDDLTVSTYTISFFLALLFLFVCEKFVGRETIMYWNRRRCIVNLGLYSTCVLTYSMYAFTELGRKNCKSSSIFGYYEVLSAPSYQCIRVILFITGAPFYGCLLFLIMTTRGAFTLGPTEYYGQFIALNILSGVLVYAAQLRDFVFLLSAILLVIHGIVYYKSRSFISLPVIPGTSLVDPPPLSANAPSVPPPSPSILPHRVSVMESYV